MTLLEAIEKATETDKKGIVCQKYLPNPATGFFDADTNTWEITNARSDELLSDEWVVAN